MKLAIRVVDGLHGHPAAGVGVRLVGTDGSETMTGGHRGVTDANGEFGYQTERTEGDRSGNFCIELDIGAYFSTMGIVSFYKKISASCQALDPDDDYQFVAVITPFMQTTLSAR